jgi:hypothetical protein
MTEAEARVLLVKAGIDELDPRIAAQPWQAIPGGWRVVTLLQGWIFRVEVAGAGQLRVTGGMPDAAPAVWLVSRR